MSNLTDHMNNSTTEEMRGLGAARFLTTQELPGGGMLEMGSEGGPVPTQRSILVPSWFRGRPRP